MGISGVRNTTFFMLCVLWGVSVGSTLIAVGNRGSQNSFPTQNKNH
jgi:hypothetical protein